MSSKQIIALIGATPPQFETCAKSLTRYEVMAVPYEDGQVDVSCLGSHVSVMLVFPGKTQSETIELCQQLRQTAALISIPLLLTVNRYDIVHAFVVRQTENADILISPFTNEELQETVQHLMAETTSK